MNKLQFSKKKKKVSLQGWSLVVSQNLTGKVPNTGIKLSLNEWLTVPTLFM